jgi:hypothetical protein
MHFDIATVSFKGMSRIPNARMPADHSLHDPRK